MAVFERMGICVRMALWQVAFLAVVVTILPRSLSAQVMQLGGEFRVNTFTPYDQNWGSNERLGHGIAVAFVATVYGVAVANLVFLPIANKLKSRLHRSLEEKEFLLEGAMAIIEGLHPNLIRHKLLAFASEIADSPGSPEDRRGRGRAASAVRSAA